jgi:hypothetical protein
MELSVDCLKETFTVSGSLPEPLEQAASAVEASAVRVNRAVNRTVERTA